MLVNLYVLNDEYNKYQTYRKWFFFLKEKKWQFYKEHKEEIDQDLETYLNIEDDNEEKEFLNNHKILKTHLIFDVLTQRYKVEYRHYKSSVNPFEPHRRVIALKHDNDNNYDLYDLETNETLSLSRFDRDKQEYIIEGMRRADSFICFAEKKHIPLLKVILKDIKFKYKNNEEHRDYTCNDINVDFIKADIFDNPDSAKKKKNEVYDYEINNLEKNFASGMVSEREFLIGFYYYQILKNKDVEHLYLSSDDDKKEYILEAYYRLSSYSELNSNHPYHERTQSQIINNAILRRKYKNPNE